ncbi:7308_t:CDS:2, partial [Gigaspora margarita]
MYYEDYENDCGLMILKHISDIDGVEYTVSSFFAMMSIVDDNIYLRINKIYDEKNNYGIKRNNSQNDNCFGINECLNISEGNKQILKDALIKLIHNTIDDNELAYFEIELEK